MYYKNWLTSAFFLIAFFLLTSFSAGDRTTTNNEQPIPVKGVQLTNKHSDLPTLKPLDSMMERVMANLRLEGATVALVKNEKLVYAKGFGFADKEGKVAVEPYHRFRIGSVSKLLTAVAVLKLVDSGKISLDDYVFGEKGILKGKPYDKVSNRNVFQIKVKHLLNHTGGWSLITYGDPMFIPHKIHKMDKVSYPIEFDDVIKFVLTRHLPYRPGTRFDYSNFGYCLLGRVIEEITGEGYEEWVVDNILKPNGIKNMAIAGNFEKDRLKNGITPALIRVSVGIENIDDLIKDFDQALNSVK